MCGIVGYSGHFNGCVARANARQAHRGPDDRGEFVDTAAGIALGHVRLSILDPSPAGHQPMSGDDGLAVIVFNGEIYNFRELRAELVARGHTFRSTSDTEVLLNLYLAEGHGMLSRLNGIFAFAIWDGRKRSLFLARDALGVKPLYYASLTRGFAFASEIKSLLEIAPEARELDLAGLHRYLTFLWCPGEATPLADVRKMAPGEAMVVNEGRISRRWFWYTLPFFQPTSRALPTSEAVAATSHHLRQAVHRQMVADVPVGAFLSGGLDSSAVVAFARERNPGIQCFTIDAVGGQEAGTTDDVPYAREVAQHLGVPLEIVTIEAGRMADKLTYMVQQLDEPLADPAPLNVLYISQLARECGFKVLLSGAGGDDLFTGYRRHAALQYDRYWRWLPVRIRSALEGMTSRCDHRKRFRRQIAKVFNGAALSPDERLISYFFWAREADLLRLYSPEVRAQVEQSWAGAPMLDFVTALPSSTEPLTKMLALEQRFFLADHNLTYTDKMSMAAGVEVRVPFLDVDLVDHAARIPLKLKQRHGLGKWILKKAMEPYLPRRVIYRPKSSFGAPLRRWMNNELRPLLRDTLSAASLKRRGLFDAGAVQQLMTDNDTGVVDGAYTLLSLLSIELWCRAYVDRP